MSEDNMTIEIDIRDIEEIEKNILFTLLQRGSMRKRNYETYENLIMAFEETSKNK